VTVYPLVKEGYDLLQKGAYMDAVQSLCQAVILDRDDVSARRYLALSLIKIDNADRALEQMGLVGRLTPPTAFDYFIYGEAYFALGKYKEAEDAYLTSVALEKDPQQADTARSGVIKCLVDALEWDKATAECQKFLKQAKTKEQKAYFQTMLKKIKEAKAGPPPEKEDETPPSVPAPAPSPAPAPTQSATTAPSTTPASSTTASPSFVGPPAPTPSPQAPADSSTPAQASPAQASPPLTSPLQPPAQSPLPATPKVPSSVPKNVPKTTLPTVKTSPTLP